MYHNLCQPCGLTPQKAFVYIYQTGSYHYNSYLIGKLSNEFINIKTPFKYPIFRYLSGVCFGNVNSKQLLFIAGLRIYKLLWSNTFHLVLIPPTGKLIDWVNLDNVLILNTKQNALYISRLLYR